MRLFFFYHKYNSVETFFFSFHSAFSPRQLIRKAILGLFRCSCIYWSYEQYEQCVSEEKQPPDGPAQLCWEPIPHSAPDFCNTQKSAGCVTPTEICLTVSTVHFCCLFPYFFLIPPLTPSPACKGHIKGKTFPYVKWTWRGNACLTKQHSEHQQAAPPLLPQLHHHCPSSCSPVLTGAGVFALL